MSTKIEEQMAVVHQQIREFVEEKYPGYQAWAIRNNSCAYYAHELKTIIEFYVEAAKKDKSMYIYLAVDNGSIRVLSSKEEEEKENLGNCK